MLRWLREYREWRQNRSGLMGLSFKNDDTKALADIVDTRGFEVIKLAFSDAAMRDWWMHGVKAVRAPGLAAALNELTALEIRVKKAQQEEARKKTSRTQKPDDKLF